MLGANAFARGVPVVPGTNTVAIAATDPNGNTSTATYEVDVTDAAKTFTYDANGNLTSDGTRTLEWDARNQLVAVTIGTYRSEFVYDGLQRRVRQVEKDNGLTTADTRVLWCETATCEERVANGVTVTRRTFGLGEQVNGTARFFTTDHLGSVREVTDAADALLARYAFDAWGLRTVTDGTDVTNAGLSGHPLIGASQMYGALFRVYDPLLARWLSPDPLGHSVGTNWYAYVDNNPLSFVDHLGLSKGGKQNISVNHKGQEFTSRSSERAVGKAIDEARREGMGARHIAKLKGIYKVIRRGGTMGLACTLMDCGAYVEAMECVLNPTRKDCYSPVRPPVTLCEM